MAPLESRMKAVAVFPEHKRIQVIDAAAPELTGPSDVKVKILEVGVCGTDREIARFEYGSPPDGSDHLIVGHESLGQVVQTGDEVKRIRTGDLVVLMVRRPCPDPDCAACRRGRQDFCYTGHYAERGIKGRHGYMAEFVVDDEAYVVRVPPELRPIGVLTEPLTIAEKAMEQVGQVQARLPWGLPGRRAGRPTYRHQAVVIGAGPVGLLGMMLLVDRGFEVHVYSREAADDPKGELVEKVGARYVCSADADIEHFAGSIGNIDLVYEATGAAQVSFDLLEQLGTNAVFAFTGVPGRKHPFEMDGAVVMRNMVLRNQVLLGTVNPPRRAYEAAVRSLRAFATRWPGAAEALITARPPLDQAPAILRAPPQGIKTVIRVGGQD
jgi:threonine dehydrogenase-like Zn-dependent dehydrogenase